MKKLYSKKNQKKNKMIKINRKKLKLKILIILKVSFLHSKKKDKKRLFSLGISI